MGRKTDDQKTDNLSRQKQQKQWKKDRRVRLTDVTRGGVYNEILSRFEAPPQMKTDTQSQIQCKCKYKYKNRIFPEIKQILHQVVTGWAPIGHQLSVKTRFFNNLSILKHVL